MNSLPSLTKGKIVRRRSNNAAAKTSPRKRNTKFSAGSYSEIRNRFTGFFSSGAIFPRISNVISTGASVIASNAAKNIENVLVKASGLKSRPSWAVSENTGRKLTVITSSEKKSGRPTVFAAPTMTSNRSLVSGSRPCSSRNCSSALCAFSTMMMAASIIAPMAIAIPPKDMMLLVRCE